MKIQLFSIAVFVSLAVFPLSVKAGSYVDHRGHNVDSLEMAIAGWSADRIAEASDEELLHLVYDWHDLMMGYLNINGERSLYYSRKVFNTSVRKGWKDMVWTSAKVIGQHFWAREQYDSATFYYNTALQTIRTMKVGEVDLEHPDGLTQYDIDDGLSSMYGTIGNLYSIQDSIGPAMEYYAKAGEIFERHGWNNSLSSLYYNMAETWFEEGDILKAKENYDLGLEYAIKAEDSLWIAGNKAGLGKVEMSERHLRKAIRLLDEAGQYYSAHDDQEWQGLLDNLDYTNQVLRLQKRQARSGLIISIAAILLLIACALIYCHMRKLRQQKIQTDEVLNETIGELAPATDTAGIKLNDRELQILELVAEGLSVKEIANRICLSPETVKWYRKKLLTKFDVSSFIVLVNKAKEIGYLK